MKYNIIQPFSLLHNLFNKGQQRSIKIKKNIAAAFIIKCTSIAISLVLVPLTINYINPTRYGIWLTISSIVAWFSFFDIGLSQGLRNKFAEAKTLKNDHLAQVYVSTAYAILACIFTGIWVVFVIANNFLNWSHILNISKSLSYEVSILALIVFTYFCIQFIFRTITTLLLADQESAGSSLIDVIGQIVCLFLIALAVKYTVGSLITLGIILCGSPLMVLLISNIILFRGKYAKYKPKFSKIRPIFAKDLFTLGMKFFIIQIASIIQYETANIIIARNFGTLEVTSYNIVYKYFSILNMVFMIFITPFWSASTEAYLKNDFAWIKACIKKYNYLNLLMFFLGLLMLIFSDVVYKTWLGQGKVPINFELSLSAFLFFSIGMFGSKYVFFLNGINALKIQFWTSLIAPFLYVIVVMIFINVFRLGVYSLFIAAIVVNINAYLLAPMQYYKIIIQGKKGIWVK
jgi:O-antigen/teichoic acid export membrane protein